MPVQQPPVSVDDVPLNDRALLGRLALSADLPSPVGIAMRILELGRDPEVSLADLSKVVGLDPALSAKLIRLANSPLYARQRKTENVRQAVNLLGLQGTTTLALSFSVMSSLRAPGQIRFDLNAFWRRSLATATCAQLLAERLALAGKEDLFLAGLLLDVGMLALAQARPELYTQVSCLEQRRTIQSHEHEVLGADHAAVGDWLLEQWRFPERTRSVMLASHRLLADGDGPAGDVPAQVLALGAEAAELWCSPSSLVSLSELMRRAGNSLGLDDRSFLDTLERAKASVQETAALFEVELEDSLQIEALITEARELTMLRHIKAMQESARLEHTTELLEARTRKLEEETRRDILTGLFNRAHLERILQDELTAAHAGGCPLTVMFIDLDGFKGKNDRHGHLAGDQILRNAARTLAQCTRENDLAFRYGGDEFVVVLPGSGGDAALSSCTRILEALRTMHRPVEEDAALAVTASIGVAIHGQPERFARAEDILAAADEALYTAKRLGRNRMTLYSGKAEST